MTQFSPLQPYGMYLLPWNQSSDTIGTKTLSSPSPTQMMLQIKFDCDRQPDHRDIHV